MTFQSIIRNGILSLILCSVDLAGFSRSLAAEPAAGEWKSLLDQKLSGWEIWMGTPHQSVQGLPEGTPASKNGYDGIPLGLNKDPKGVFTVRMEEGEPVLHITGEILGGLTSLESFSNYHLRVQFKWGDKRWDPRADDARDNGILYHCSGKHGAFWNAWKRCLEFQVQERDMGDLFLLAGIRADVKASQVDGKWYFDPKGEVHRFGESGPGVLDASPAHLRGDFEKPKGKWNDLDIYTVGRSSIHVVNGTVVNALTYASTVTGADKAEAPLGEGQIQIQSEAAEAYYRRIQIQPITEFPEELKKAAGW